MDRQKLYEIATSLPPTIHPPSSRWSRPEIDAYMKQVREVEAARAAMPEWLEVMKRGVEKTLRRKGLQVLDGGNLPENT